MRFCARRRRFSRPNPTGRHRDDPYIDEHKGSFRVEGICRVLGAQLACGLLTASEYWAAKRREPAARTLSDRELLPILERLHAAGVYGVRRCGGCSTSSSLTTVLASRPNR